VVLEFCQLAQVRILVLLPPVLGEEQLCSHFHFHFRSLLLYWLGEVEGLCFLLQKKKKNKLN
jgi:hypothetical protein